MRIILSTAMSVDGYIDDRRDERLILSNADDLAAVQELRTGCDAIFVGANTIRRDNPSLSPRDDAQRQMRMARGLAPEPLKITMTRSGNLPVAARFFRDGDGPKLVYHARHTAPARFAAEIISVTSFADVIDDLRHRKLNRLLVEGGTETATAFLQSGIVNEWRLVIAPVFVGDSAAPRAVGPGAFPQSMTVDSVQKIGDMVVITYLLKEKQ